MAHSVDPIDARKVFLWSNERSEFSPASIADAFPTINSRYARQILQFLVHLGLVVEGMTEWEGYYWEQGAEAAFDEALASKQSSEHPRRERTMNDNNTAVNACLCGCGSPVSRKRLYRPGHDARHASRVARQLATWAADKAKTEITRSEAGGLDDLNTLGSGTLAEKALDQANRILANKAGKSQAWETGTAKVGRWDYPARRRGNRVQVNTRRDGGGSWKNLDSERFIPAA